MRCRWPTKAATQMLCGALRPVSDATGDSFPSLKRKPCRQDKPKYKERNIIERLFL